VAIGGSLVNQEAVEGILDQSQVKIEAQHVLQRAGESEVLVGSPLVVVLLE